MMSDKPHPPTEKRLRDARAEGRFARSEILTGLAVSALATEAAFACVDAGIERWLALQNAAFSQLASAHRDDAFMNLIAQAGCLIAAAAGIVTAAAFIAAIVAAWACGGLTFAPSAIRPSFNRLSAARHIKELFDKKHLAAIALSIATAGIVGAVACWQLRERLPLVAAMLEWRSLVFDLNTGIAALHAFVRVVFAVLLAPAVLAAIVARGRHRRTLHMSHRELKDELKQTSGDPAMRARQRMSFSEAGAATSARPARGKYALIVNPEHFAVLLRYAGDPSEPPIVIDKAIDDDAVHMASTALRDRVIVFRFRLLARRLYRHAERQSPIPPDCYRAVAIVYRIVEELEGLDERPNGPIDIDDDAFDR